MKPVILALGLMPILAGQSLADCTQSLAELDGIVRAAGLAPDVKAQLHDMRQQAEQLCAAGNEDESADVIAEALALLAAESK